MDLNSIISALRGANDPMPFGAGALPAEADVVDAIRSGAMKAAPLHQLHDVADFTDKYKLLKPSPQQGQMPSTSPQWFL